MAERRRISLCLIVRDEEQLLPDCLASAADLVDEIVVVDTGSTDRTVEVAEAYGARVLHHPWSGDFAEARNVSIDAARGDFVLVLDADERMAEGSAEHVRALVDAEAEGAPPTLYLPLISNLDRHGNTLGADHMPRLWRRRPELRFTGRVHERVGVGVEGLQRRYEDAFHIVHLGYDPELSALRDKRARNVRLLEAELAERPDDPALHFYLAKEHYAAGEDEQALAGFLRVVADGSIVNFALSARLFACECLTALGRPKEGMDLALEALREHGDYGELWFVAGKAAMAAGRPIQAEAQFEKARQQPKGVAATAFRDPSVSAWRADVERGRVMIANGDVVPGIAALDGVRERVPGPERIALDLDVIDGWIIEGKEQLAFERLTPLLDEAPDYAAPPLLRFINLYVDLLGPQQAHDFVEKVLSQHDLMLHQLSIVAAAAELADMIGDEDRLLEWLTICAHLNSPIPQHYVALAKLLKARGDVRGAQQALFAAQRLLTTGGEA